MLTILSHLLKGESIIEKHLKDKEIATNSTSTNAQNKTSPSGTAIVSNSQQASSEPAGHPSSRLSNPLAVAEERGGAQSQFLDILVDMGFTREMAGDALVHNSFDVEQAAEWLLAQSNMARLTVSVFPS